MVTGMIMQGAILTNKSPMTLQSVTPIARLVGEYEMLAVTSDSPIKTLADLIEKLKADPRSVSWAGGSVGGTDQILAGLIGQKVGIDPKQINYIAHSGGGEAMQSLLGGHTTVGVNGYAELAPQVAAGKLRALAISSDERLPGIDVPTLKEQGVDISLANWRGIVAAPDIRTPTAKPSPPRSPRWSKARPGKNHRDPGVDRHVPARRGIRRIPEEGQGAGRRRPEGHRSGAVGSAATT